MLCFVMNDDSERPMRNSDSDSKQDAELLSLQNDLVKDSAPIDDLSNVFASLDGEDDFLDDMSFSFGLDLMPGEHSGDGKTSASSRGAAQAQQSTLQPGDNVRPPAASKVRAADARIPKNIAFPSSHGSTPGKTPKEVKEESLWMKRFQQLLTFRHEEGHTMVPFSYPPNQALSHWVKRMRYHFKKKSEGLANQLSDERQKMLEEIDFCWNAHRESWEGKFAELLEYRKVNGDTNVPATFNASPSLGIWVKCQRRQFKLLSQGKRSNLTLVRMERLHRIGFVWTPRNPSQGDDLIRGIRARQT